MTLLRRQWPQVNTDKHSAGYCLHPKVSQQDLPCGRAGVPPASGYRTGGTPASGYRTGGTPAPRVDRELCARHEDLQRLCQGARVVETGLPQPERVWGRLQRPFAFALRAQGAVRGDAVRATGVSMKPLRKHATYDDLVAVPEHMVAEIIDGELYASPRPTSPHAYAASAIGGELWGPFGSPPSGAGVPTGWWIVDEPELHFGADVLVPDLAGWRRERLPRFPNAPYMTLAPDWVCEVVSPTTGALDRRRKMPIYTREQIPHLWLVDPLARTLEVYRIDAGRWVVVGTFGGAEHVHAEPVDAVALDLTRWWLEP